ncbi:MAG TPA: hypothetical protein VNH83_10480 [Bryobacteraceae bacterium]|nr:hypothetical protein [Bryobacteraceae bacterium]
MIRQQNKADRAIDPSTRTSNASERIDRNEQQETAQRETEQISTPPYQPWLYQGDRTDHLMRSRCRGTLNAEQSSTELVLLALKILTSGYEPNTANSVTAEEVDELESYLGDEAAGRSLDEIACIVIQREIRRQDEQAC